MSEKMLRSVVVDDDIAEASSGAVEVTVTLTDGRRRWCFFMIPEAFAACGDVISGTDVRLHFGPHMIVVSEISEQLIKQALLAIDAEGELEACTLPLES